MLPALVAAAGCGRLGFDTTPAVDATLDEDAPSDATTDTATPDALLDAPTAACLSNTAYVAVGGQAHRYRQVTAAATWDAARQACSTDGAYLWIPDDAGEANALDGDWIGITDAAIEGTWLTVRGDTATYLPWLAGEPDGGSSENCGRTDGTGFEARECVDVRDYVCECE